MSFYKFFWGFQVVNIHLTDWSTDAKEPKHLKLTCPDQNTLSSFQVIVENLFQPWNPCVDLFSWNATAHFAYFHTLSRRSCMH